MASVISNEVCPNCGDENADVEFHYKTGEEYLSCSRCGYYYSHLMERNSDGTLTLAVEADGYSPENIFWVDTVIDKPYGAYRLAGADYFPVNLGTLHSLEDEYALREFVSSRYDEISTATISKYNGEVFIEEDLLVTYRNIPVKET